MLLAQVAVIAGVFCGSIVLTGWCRRNSAAYLAVDVPNSRSSHTTATPRGGGVAIVVTTLIAFAVLGWVGWLPWRSVLCLCGGGAIVAAVGLADDRAGVPARWRLLGHFGASLVAMAAMGGSPPITAMGLSLSAGWLGWTVVALYMVWMVNLTNFMDGIDGVAGIETTTVCAGAALLSSTAGPGGHLWLAPAVLASATLGFLVWNWPPAKIFMGDVGSGFLGLMLSILALESGWVDSRLFWSWVILCGVFVVDATVTLIRRVARGERFYLAHRTHAYQHAAVRLGVHKPVTLAIGAINVLWLLPLAYLAASGRVAPVAALAIAYVPLVIVAVRLGAGTRPVGS